MLHLDATRRECESKKRILDDAADDYVAARRDCFRALVKSKVRLVATADVTCRI